MVYKEYIERRMEEFRRMCRERGLRITPQRLEVFRVVTSSEEHPDAETILKQVRRNIPNISLDSVYRIIYMLESEGMISRVPASSDRLRFDGNADKHHHFICSECGVIMDFESEKIDNMPVPGEVGSWGIIESRHLMVQGVCRDCLAKRGRAVEN